MHKRFFIRFLLFLLPFFIVFLFNFIVDPFNYNARFNLGFNKKEISLRTNYRLYKILEYRNHSTPNILLGDSRMFAFPVDTIDKVSGLPYYNFAYGAATLPEILETFWYAASLTDLKNVYMGIPFNLFSSSNSKSMFAQARKITANPMDYYLSSFTLKVSFYNVYDKFFHKNLYSENPGMDKNRFWVAQLAATDDSYRVFNWPEEYITGLKEIKKYCEKKDIHLVFIIPPTHTDLQDKVKENHLEKDYARYKATLRSITQTIDYDTVSDITTSRDNFKDPYHCKEEVVARMIHEIWGKERK